MTPILSGTKIAAGLAVSAMLAIVGQAFAAETSHAPERGKWQSRLELGKPAQDFELPLLKWAEDEKGEKVGRITDEKIKLSSYRGKKVVCLFMSSYT
jgi:hypothetical protein